MKRSKPLLELKSVGFGYTTRGTLFRRKRFQALRDVSFCVNPGETLGIVGRNGCGKSTLLRVIAGIYRHESGELIRNYERASLLALAVGFDNELTGRQNAVMSGILLGARRKDVESKLVDIIEFSELQRSIDEPLKYYSTGMRARLAFSVAIVLESDLIMIDEVLGVGDAAFRVKAEKAMVDRISSSQSVMFVSHAPPQVKRLCDRAIWIDEGFVKLEGETEDVIGQYEEHLLEQSAPPQT